MLGYRQRIFALCESLLGPHGPWRRALDFGSGDGWFAQEFQRQGLISEIVPVDVLRRNRVLIEPVVYTGERLPYPDRAFDLAYSIDVLHHCPDPQASLADLLRCTRDGVLIKDHICRGRLDWWLLSLLDEIGNRRHGVPSPHHYQQNWEWSAILTREGFSLDRLVHPAHCQPWFLSPLMDHVQFLALWRRRPE